MQHNAARRGAAVVLTAVLLAAGQGAVTATADPQWEVASPSASDPQWESGTQWDATAPPAARP